MDKTELATLEPLFKVEVSDKVEDIDPGAKEDWYSLALGWALGKGYNPNRAHEIAGHLISVGLA